MGINCIAGVPSIYGIRQIFVENNGRHDEPQLEVESVRTVGKVLFGNVERSAAHWLGISDIKSPT